MTERHTPHVPRPPPDAAAWDMRVHRPPHAPASGGGGGGGVGRGVARVKVCQPAEAELEVLSVNLRGGARSGQRSGMTRFKHASRARLMFAVGPIHFWPRRIDNDVHSFRALHD